VIRRVRPLRNIFDFLLGLFHGCLKVLLHHFDFLLDQIQLRLHRFSEIIGGFFQTLDGSSNLTADLWELLRSEQQKGDDKNNQYFSGTQTKHGSFSYKRRRRQHGSRQDEQRKFTGRWFDRSTCELIPHQIIRASVARQAHRAVAAPRASVPVMALALVDLGGVVVAGHFAPVPV
jgi:hypothetical protein